MEHRSISAVFFRSVLQPIQYCPSLKSGYSLVIRGERSQADGVQYTWTGGTNR